MCQCVCVGRVVLLQYALHSSACNNLMCVRVCVPLWASLEPRCRGDWAITPKQPRGTDAQGNGVPLKRWSAKQMPFRPRCSAGVLCRFSGPCASLPQFLVMLLRLSPLSDFLISFLFFSASLCYSVFLIFSRFHFYFHDLPLLPLRRIPVLSSSSFRLLLFPLLFMIIIIIHGYLLPPLLPLPQ